MNRIIVTLAAFLAFGLMANENANLASLSQGPQAAAPSVSTFADSCLVVGRKLAERADCAQISALINQLSGGQTLGEICKSIASSQGVSSFMSAMICPMIESKFDSTCKEGLPKVTDAQIVDACNAINKASL